VNEVYKKHISIPEPKIEDIPERVIPSMIPYLSGSEISRISMRLQPDIPYDPFFFDPLKRS
jgi:hypothetical protein